MYDLSKEIEHMYK